jgi:hypothetical protein
VRYVVDVAIACLVTEQRFGCDGLWRYAMRSPQMGRSSAPHVERGGNRRRGALSWVRRNCLWGDVDIWFETFRLDRHSRPLLRLMRVTNSPAAEDIRAVTAAVQTSESPCDRIYDIMHRPGAAPAR